MTISVKNLSSSKIEVAVNRWGGGGSTSYFSVDPGDDESWSRSDERGFIMAIKRGTQETPYYVSPNSSVAVYAGHVADQYGNTLQPATESRRGRFERKITQTVPFIVNHASFDDYGPDGYNAFGYNTDGADRNGYKPRIIKVDYPVYSAHDNSYDESWDFRKTFWERYGISGDRFQKMLFTGERGCDVILILAHETENTAKIGPNDQYIILDNLPRT